MKELDKKIDLGQEPGRAPDDGEVRVTIERAREAIQDSAAEIERARRLLRETENLVDSSSQPKDCDDESAT